MSGIDFGRINAAALARLPSLLARWLPDGKATSGEWFAKNPTRPDHRAGSFSVNMQTGVWNERAVPGASGGDPVSLYAYLHNIKQGEAAQRLAAELGIDGQSPQHPKAEKAPAPQKPKVTWTPIVKPEHVRRPGDPWPNGGTIAFPSHRLGIPKSWWWFENDVGQTICGEARFEFDGADGERKKEVRPLTYCRDDKGRMGWRWQAPQKPWPLFNLPLLAAEPDKPVIVTEGCRKAIKAAELFPGYIGTAALFGAKSPQHAYWKSLAGRNVTIWPDHDDAGSGFAATVAALAMAAGAASVAIVQVLDTFPSKWDLCDPLPDGVTDEDLRNLLANAAPWTPPPAAVPDENFPHESAATLEEVAPPEYRSFGAYEMSDKGLFRVEIKENKDGEPEEKRIWLSSPFEVLANTRNGDSEAWGKLLRWRDPDGHKHE